MTWPPESRTDSLARSTFDSVAESRGWVASGCLARTRAVGKAKQDSRSNAWATASSATSDRKNRERRFSFAFRELGGKTSLRDVCSLRKESLRFERDFAVC